LLEHGATVNRNAMKRRIFFNPAKLNALATFLSIRVNEKSKKDAE